MCRVPIQQRKQWASVDDHAKPLASLDTVNQCRQHPRSPDRCVHPRPLILVTVFTARGFGNLFSCCQHSRSCLCISLNVANPLSCLPSHATRYAARSGDDLAIIAVLHRLCIPSRYTRTRDIPRFKHRTFMTFHPQTRGVVRASLGSLAQRARQFELRLGSAGSSQHSAESGSLSYGPPLRLQLLSTPYYYDAVTFDFKALSSLWCGLPPHRYNALTGARTLAFARVTSLNSVPF